MPQPRPNTPMQETQQKFVLFDVSLFILDVLDTGKIQKNYLENNVLEVPGALATMIVDARAGNPLLSQLVTAYYSYIRRHYPTSSDERIQRLLMVSEEKSASVVSNIVQTIIYKYGPIISGTAGEIQQGTDERQTFRSPILRYEPIYNLPPAEIQNLQFSYTTELGLPQNSIFDIYFRQLLHAQAIGINGSQVGIHELISVGHCTNNVLKKYFDHGMKKYESAFGPFPQRGLINDQAVRSTMSIAKDRLGQLINLYLQPTVEALINIGVSILFSWSQTGVVKPDDLVLAIVGYASTELISRSFVKSDVPVTYEPRPVLPYLLIFEK